jgi:hypothetical protein
MFLWYGAQNPKLKGYKVSSNSTIHIQHMHLNYPSVRTYIHNAPKNSFKVGMGGGFFMLWS